MRITTLTVAALAILASAAPADAQYGTRARERESRFTISLAPTMLLGFSEVVRARQPVDPLDPYRLIEERPLTPGLGVQLRWGRSFQLYAGGASFLGTDADITGRDPASGEAVDSTVSVSGTHMASVGISFIPAQPLHLEFGVGNVWVGDGGDYLSFRGAAFLDVWELTDDLLLATGFEFWAGGGSSRDSDLDRQLRDGWLGAFSIRLDWALY